MKKREATTIAVHGARDEPGSRAITDESSQLTADLCDLNLVARKKGDPTRAAGGGSGKKSQGTTAIERTGIRLSVGRLDQDTLNNSSPRSNAGSDDRQPPCVFALRVECAPTLFPQKRHGAMVKANLHTVFLMIIFWIKKEACKLYPRDKTKIIIRKKRKSGGTNDKSI